MTVLLEMNNIVKHFGSVVALNGVSIKVKAGEVHCLLGDNGAGKSTFIKTMSGVYTPTSGRILVEGKEVRMTSPRDAADLGIATVFQDLAMIPLMSVTRNFFLGREITLGYWPFQMMNLGYCDDITNKEMRKIGIDVRDSSQAVGTLSGGERQTVAIARAVYFGAKVLILDEPTSALGVRQTSIVLKYIDDVRKRGVGIVFISHNVRHALAVGDQFTVLNRGKTIGTAARGEISSEELQTLMAGGIEITNFEDSVEAAAV